MNVNLEAPVVQKKEITIDASPESVWQVLTDIDHWNDWNSRIKNPQLDGAIGDGATFSWTTGGSRIKSTIHTFEPQTALGWSGKAFGASAIHNWYLDPAKNGTLVRVEESMQGWLVSLLKKSINKRLASDMPYWLQQLKIESEKSS